MPSKKLFSNVALFFFSSVIAVSLVMMLILWQSNSIQLAPPPFGLTQGMFYVAMFIFTLLLVIVVLAFLFYYIKHE